MIEAAIVRIKEDKEPVGIFVYDGKFRDDLYYLFMSISHSFPIFKTKWRDVERD